MAAARRGERRDARPPVVATALLLFEFDFSLFGSHCTHAIRYQTLKLNYTYMLTSGARQEIHTG